MALADFTAETRLRDCSFCALDLETTGVNPLIHEIIEIAALRFTLGGGIERVFHQLVRPAGAIPAEATALHGINDAMTANAPAIGDVIKKIYNFIAPSIVIAHNVSFDISFLVMAWDRKGTPQINAADSERMARRAFPGLDTYRLEALCSRLGTAIGPHRALPDAYGCMEVFRASLGALDPGGTWTVGEMIRRFGQLQRPWQKASRTRKNMAAVPVKIGGNKALLIRYRGADGGETEREIEPFEIIRYGRRSYLKAYCRLRKDVRLFRTDRIKVLSPGGELTTFCAD